MLNCFFLGRLTLFTAFAVAPVLPIAFFSPSGRLAIFLLRLPARPSPRRFPALCTAIALARLPRLKTPLASFEQAAAHSWPPAPVFPSAWPPDVLPFRYDSREGPWEVLLPEAPCSGGDLHSPPECSGHSGLAQNRHSIAIRYASDERFFSASRRRFRAFRRGAIIPVCFFRLAQQPICHWRRSSRHQPMAAWPGWHRQSGPISRRHRHTNVSVGQTNRRSHL